MKTAVHTPAMKKYYVAMALLLLGALAAVVLTFAANADDRADKLANAQLNTAHTAVKNYATAAGAVPSTLQATKPEGPTDRVTYKRLNDSLYMLCATYRRERGGSVNPDTDVAAGDNWFILSSLRQKDPQTTYAYYDGYYHAADYRHAKGKYCAVISQSGLRKQPGAEIFNNLPSLRAQ